MNAKLLAVPHEIEAAYRGVLLRVVEQVLPENPPCLLVLMMVLKGCLVGL